MTIQLNLLIGYFTIVKLEMESWKEEQSRSKRRFYYSKSSMY